MTPDLPPAAPPPPASIRTMENPAVTPDWAKDAIWYQIFPERFRNGTPESSPRPEDFSSMPLPGWRIRPWGMEWYARDDWETAQSSAFWDTVFNRRYGGDLAGIREKLPYLRNLGVNALYLNPVFHAASLHKYDATSYHHIDPTFGPDRAGDLRALAAANETEDPSTWIWTRADLAFLDFLDEAHAQGFHVIIDGVFNHSGRQCFAFQDILKNGTTSRYADWYQISKFREDGTIDYAAWDGPNGSLPAFSRSETNLNDGVKAYLFNITRRWMRPVVNGHERGGIDGWRLDVAFCLPHGFWREWHHWVRTLRPDAYTTAEIVGPAQDWLRPDEFSAVMNYEWLFPTLSFFTPHAHALTATEFRAAIDRLHARHAPGTIAILQNLLDSHDTGRILTMLHSACPPFTNWDSFFQWARVADNPALRTDAPSADAKTRLRLSAVWQFTGPGAPMLYYGTEVGLWGANDPCDRQPMLWPDIPAAPETLGFRGPLEHRTPRAPDESLLAFYRTLTALRRDHPALRRGTFRWLPGGDENTLLYERRLGDDCLLVAIQKGPTPVSLPPPFNLTAPPLAPLDYRIEVVPAISTANGSAPAPAKNMLWDCSKD